ncbi:MAG: hypothetical protein IKI03_07275 [Clostridia bacterium]|nr:hypothetical protein [Clostridia bacterium]
MDNKTIYKKTLVFSLRRVLWDLLCIAVVLGFSTLGFFILDKMGQDGYIGLLIGFVVGLIPVIIILRFVSYSLKAGQIAMITRGVTEGDLPDNVVKEGKRVVRERFATVAVYFAATKVIKGIFNQIGRGISKVGSAIGGDAGGAVGDAIGSAVQTVVNYLCDCCLGWVFFRKDENAAKATCEGAVLFFKHGKTLAKNMGRIFGIGLLTLLLIGGVFTGVFYLILSRFSVSMAIVYDKVAEAMRNSSDPNWLTHILENRATLPIAFAAIGGIIIWAIIHSTFIKPFVLTGVLRNYLESGMNDVPTEDSFKLLDSKSSKFRKLHETL